MASRFVFTEEAELQLLEILDYLANESEPLTIIAVLHGARDVGELLGGQ